MHICKRKDTLNSVNEKVFIEKSEIFKVGRSDKLGYADEQSRPKILPFIIQEKPAAAHYSFTVPLLFPSKESCHKVLRLQSVCFTFAKESTDNTEIMDKKISYEQAMARVEQIVEALESGETKLENLSDMLREAKELIMLCRKQLMKTEDDINKILEDGKR